MADERNEEQFKGTQDKAGQQPTSEQNESKDFGQQQGQQGGAQDTMSSRDNSDTVTSDRQSGAGGSDQPSGQGFVGSQGTDSSEYLREGGDSSETSGKSDFASQGQGAQNDDSDMETGQDSRAQRSDSDIEGSSGDA